MDTPFERMDLEVRQEWLMHPATEAFVETLTAELKRVTEAVMAGLLDGGAVDPAKYARMGGMLHALGFAVNLAGAK
jgi:hypothetical protein